MIGTTIGSTGSITLSGGTGGTAGGGGHLIYGSNDGTTVSATGAANTNAAAGSKDANPFVGGTPATPYIPNLPTIGAEIYGLSGLTAAGLYGSLPATDVNGAPLSSASGALFRTSASVLGPAFTGFDALLFINLTANPFSTPEMTLGGALQQLLDRGYVNNPVFGGSGPVLVGSLAGNAVYATLVPAGSTANPSVQITSGGNDFSASGTSIANGQALYVVPEPGTLLMLAAGVFLLPVLRRRRG